MVIKMLNFTFFAKVSLTEWDGGKHAGFDQRRNVKFAYAASGLNSTFKRTILTECVFQLYLCWIRCNN